MRTSFRLLTVLLLLLLAGCSHTRPVPRLDTTLPSTFPNHDAAAIAQQIGLSADTLQAFRAKASFAVDSPNRSGRFTADIRNRRGDSLYMSISPGLGIEAARVLVTPDSIFFYDRLKKRVTAGSLAEAGDLLAMPVTAADLFHNLLGLLAPSPDVDWQVAADSAYYHLRNPAGTQHYTVDPALWRVIRYEERTPEGELIDERRFSEFDVFHGVYLPRRLTFRRLDQSSTASLFYRDLDLNPSDLSFDLKVSSDAERVQAGD